MPVRHVGQVQRGEPLGLAQRDLLADPAAQVAAVVGEPVVARSC
jgi:hypothetical protein